MSTTPNHLSAVEPYEAGQALAGFPALNLAPLVACRDRAEQLEARLRRGDVSALADARALDEHVVAAAHAFVATVEQVAGRPLSFYGLQAGDVEALCDALAGTGHLQPMADLLDDLSTYGLESEAGE